MARGQNNSNSESESRTTARNTSGSGSNTKSNSSGSGSGKHRLNAAQQQYLKDLVNTHITNNHRDIVNPKYGPSDFEHYSDDFLRRYKDHYSLNCPDNMTINGYLLGSELGSKTYSFKRNKVSAPDARILKKDLAAEVKRHFNSYPVKEMDCIPQFIYKVKNQKKKFKMEFKSTN